MKKAFNILIAGCVLGALAISPTTHPGLVPGIVEASPSLAFITGTVKDERGAPLTGAVVALLEPQLRGKEIKSVKTDPQGKFSTDIAPGIYRLRATAEGFKAKVTNLFLDRPVRVSYDFALNRDNTMVQRRGDSKDYRWIERSAPRHVLNLQDVGDEAADKNTGDEVAVQNNLKAPPASFHGMAQLVAISSADRAGQSGPNFFGSNFALSGTLSSNVEMALIGQRGFGELAPQRISAIATMRPSDRHQVTAAVGYGQITLAKKMNLDGEISGLIGGLGAESPAHSAVQAHNALSIAAGGRSLDQLSVSAIDSWQVFQPLLVIYGFDYSRFLGSTGRENDSILPRIAVQYAPSSNLRMNAAVTPGASQTRQSIESFNTENIQATFEETPAEIPFSDRPIHDRSRRFEAGVERVFNDGDSSLEASAFYDLISGHGVGILALPLEMSPETQATFRQVVHQVTAMNGTSRGMRVVYKHDFNHHLSSSIGYSFGRGARLNKADIYSLAPSEMFKGGFFQVATAKVDLDLTHETGTRVSTVIRLSPSAVVFAIDPFAGRMSVYDPNINIYVTQDLPSFGLPIRWQAIVDIRNLFDQSTGIDDGTIQLIAARTRRTVRGGLAFRW